MNARSILLLIALGGTAVAAEAPVQTKSDPQSESTDEALFRELLGEPEQDPAAPASATATTDADTEQGSAPATPAVDPAAIERIMAGFRDAGKGLVEGRTDAPTQSAQQRTIDELQQLIDAARQQRSRSKSDSNPEGGSPQPNSAGSPSPAPSAAGQTGSSGAPGASAGQPAPTQNERAEESSDQFRTGAEPTQAIRNFRFELIRDAWGHLPPRLRDQLLGSGSDRYLPEYDTLVRQYFESLAQPKSEREPPRP